MRRPKEEEYEALKQFFKLVLEHTFESNHIGHLEESLRDELVDKDKYLREDFESEGQKRFFLVALNGETIIGTIAYGPANETIVDCSNGELKDVPEIGTVFVHPEYQKQGVLNVLLKGIMEALVIKAETCFCFDSGYPIAQKIWTKKFGPPLYWLKDYWALGADHMIWKANLDHEGLRGKKHENRLGEAL